MRSKAMPRKLRDFVNLKTDRQNRSNRKICSNRSQYNNFIDDISRLNSLIIPENGDKFRKFAQGLTLENLVYSWAGNYNARAWALSELKRKADDGLELQVLDTAGRCDARHQTSSRGESSVSLALAPRVI